MTTDTVGGVFAYVVNLARELAVRDVEVIVATMGQLPSPAQRLALSQIKGVQVYESNWRLEWMDDPWVDVDSAGQWLLKLERLTKPDIIHLNGYAHAALNWWAPTVVVAHSCVCSWWRSVYGTAAPSRYDVYRERVRAGLGEADLIVTPTRWMQKALSSEYGAEGLSIVVPNGIHHSSQFSEPATQRKESCFLAAGRAWDAAKNVEVLEGVASRLPWPTYVAGDRGERRDSAASDSDPECPGGVVPRLLYLGVLSRSQIERWMRRAAVFLHMARYEPFGLAPLEAASAGCAIVLGDIESLREVWVDAALYVDPDDAEELTRVAHRLARDEPWRKLLANRARQRASSFSAAKMAEAYLECYFALLSGMSRRMWAKSDWFASQRHELQR